MIKNKIALFSAVATLGVLGGGFLSPAQAIFISYNVTGSFAGGGTLSGSFDFDAGTSTYQNISLFSSNGIGNTNYTSTNSTVVTSTSTALTLSSDAYTSPDFRGLFLEYSADLPTTIGDKVDLNPYSVSGSGVSGSRETLFISPGGGLSGSYGISGGVVTAVPWETDALSVIGVTTLFAFGVWTKRRRGVTLSNPVDLSNPNEIQDSN